MTIAPSLRLKLILHLWALEKRKLRQRRVPRVVADFLGQNGEEPMPHEPKVEELTDYNVVACTCGKIHVYLGKAQDEKPTHAMTFTTNEAYSFAQHLLTAFDKLEGL
jgi:hypothetical protein